MEVTLSEEPAVEGVPLDVESPEEVVAALSKGGNIAWS